MAKLMRTSVQLEEDVVVTLSRTYPNLTLSLLIRLALRYVAEVKPTFCVTETHEPKG